MQALVFGLGNDLFAVDAAVAREVVAAPTITPLPTAPATILGVFNLRGEILPVFDTARLLDLAPVDDPPFVAVVSTAHGNAALSTSALGETVELGEPIGESDAPGARGAFDVRRRVVVLLDVEDLLGRARVLS